MTERVLKCSVAFACVLLLDARQSLARPIAIANVTVVDPRNSRLTPNMTVLIDGGKTVAVTAAKSAKLPPGTRVLEGRGKFLIPGLWDMHAHLSGPDLRRPNPEESFMAPMFIVNGITGVRSMSDPLDTVRALRASVRNGSPGPQIITAGPILDGPTPRRNPTAITCANPEQGRQAVRRLRAEGSDFIKVYESLDRETYFAIADEARRNGLPFAGHVPASIDAAEASRAGPKSIEHLSRVFLTCSSKREELSSQAGKLDLARQNVEAVAVESYDEAKCQELFNIFRENRTWQVPTLVLHEARVYIGEPKFMSDPRWKLFEADDFWARAQPRPLGFSKEQREIYLEHQVELVAKMYRAGVRILAGTDTPNPYVYPGDSFHDELRLLVRAGLTPFEALQAATSNAAEYFGFSNVLGSITPGKDADLVLLNADPTKDISNTRSISAVFAKGRFFDRADIDRMRSAAEAVKAN